ncbi:MAG TPA: hypothetical protein VE422_20760 [Terriglobia bacterium]|nr:hypothetical protein [Terriglobia bacterium]
MKKVLAVAFALAFGVTSVYAETLGGPSASGPGVLSPESEQQAPQSAQTPTSTQTTPPAKHKSIAKTVLLSLLVPGGGNFYVGDKKKGFIVLGTAVAGIALAASSIHEDCFSTSTRNSFSGYCIQEVGGGRYYGGMGMAAGANVFGLISAVSRASAINSGKISALEGLRLTVPSRKEGLKVAYNFNF